MARVPVTYDLAMAAGKDAANAQARAANREAWNAEDWNLMAATFNRLLPLPADAETGAKRTDVRVR